jgi:hypothetical protein
MVIPVVISMGKSKTNHQPSDSKPEAREAMPKLDRPPLRVVHMGAGPHGSDLRDLNGPGNNRGLTSPIHRDGRVAENLWLILVEKMVGCPKKKKNPTGVRTYYQHVT